MVLQLNPVGVLGRSASWGSFRRGAVRVELAADLDEDDVYGEVLPHGCRKSFGPVAAELLFWKRSLQK